MYDISLLQLQQLYENCRLASCYAQDHYEIISQSEHAYTLYGGEAYALGVQIPSSFVPKAARKLQKSTRRKCHIAYELNSNYQVVRTVHVVDHSRVDCIYHHFELDDVRYAYPFRGTGNELYTDEIAAISFADGKPAYFACASKNLLFVQFYEYTSPEEMWVSTYRYWPNAKFNQYGLPIDRNVPIDDPNSPVSRHCRLEMPELVDFSYYLE